MTKQFGPWNLYSDAAPPSSGERFETLLQTGPLRVERIVSSCRPDTALYDQEQDEWVMLLEGRAILEVQGNPMTLVRGDALFLPAHTPHRVLETSDGALWLAVHHQPPKAGTAPDKAT